MADILTSLFTLIIGVIIANLTSNIIKRLIRRSNRLLKKTFNTTIPWDNILSSTSKFTVYVITLILILNQQGIDFKKGFLIFLAITLILILLSFKDAFPNILVGIYLKLFKKIKLNQEIKIDDIEGKVERITFFETKVWTDKKELISIPNISLIRLLK